MPTDRGEEGDLRSASSFHGNSARKSVFMSYGLTYLSPKVVFHSGGVFVGFYDSLYVLNTVLYIIILLLRQREAEFTVSYSNPHIHSYIRIKDIHFNSRS